MMEKGFYEIIKNLAGGRVYAMRAPQNATAPFIVYQRTDSERWRSVNDPSGIAQATIQLDVYASDYFGAKDVAAAAELLLDGYRGTVAYGTNSPQDTVRIAGISLQNEFDLLDQTDEPFLYRNTAQYLVTYDT